MTWAHQAQAVRFTARLWCSFAAPNPLGFRLLEQGFKHIEEPFLPAVGFRWTKALGWKGKRSSAGMWRGAEWFLEPVWSRVRAPAVRSECCAVFTVKKSIYNIKDSFNSSGNSWSHSLELKELSNGREKAEAGAVAFASWKVSPLN